MTFEKVAQGWRGEIWLDSTSGIAKKIALDDEKRGPLLKESRILQYLKEQNIPFVPQIQEVLDDGFIYQRVEGEHFVDVYEQATFTKRKKLLVGLIDRAYSLDKVGAIHGELLRPFTNVLVTKDDTVSIIDFDRGVLGDYSGKNLKHVMQWLSNQGYLNVPTLRQYSSQSPADLFQTLHDLVQGTKEAPARSINTNSTIAPARLDYLLGEGMQETLHGGLRTYFNASVFGLLLIGVDQLSKIVIVDSGSWNYISRITPSQNPGIARSIKIPMTLVIAVSLLMLIGLVWRWKSEIDQYKEKKGQSNTLLNRGLILLISGAIGNLIDRVSLGVVRDFIDLNEFLPFSRAIFNIADIAISLGVFLLLWWEFGKAKK